MSDDLISRQDAINACSNGWGYDDETIKHIKSNILELPSVKPQPKTGHWIGIDEEPHEDYECNKCGYVVSTFTANIEPHTEYKYCPNCGAKMEGEE